MLLNLTITNFAIIDRLEVQFDDGFNVLTGETGAGKSIILDAVGLLLGDRARPDLVRAGESEATVEALFDLSASAAICAQFAAAGFPLEDELVLRRVVQAGGRSRAYINGTMTTLAQLQPLAELLVAVCGQHEHQSLAQRAVQLAMLDQYGNFGEQVERYRRAFIEMREVAQRLERMETAERDRQQRIDFLRHQSDEIAAAKISPDEADELAAERLLLQNAGRLSAIARSGYDNLYGGSGAACEVLGVLADELQEVASLDAELGAQSETVRRCMFELEDVAAQLRARLERFNFEPGRLEEIELRLAELQRLKRKYAASLSELLAQKEAFDQEIAELETAEEAKLELSEQLAELSCAVTALGEEISTSRRQAASGLAVAIREELNDLAMPGASFEVSFEPLEQPASDGLERIEFMVSTNPGEPLMPLGKVASGGELSRLMLALKRLAPAAENVPTIVFDEVDAGIGGAAATAVGRKLRAVSRSAQTLCVTHLPQVAAFADQHHRVVKQEHDGRTMTRLEFLSTEERVQEMARMLGGAQITERTLSHAKELIENSTAD